MSDFKGNDIDSVVKNLINGKTILTKGTEQTNPMQDSFDECEKLFELTSNNGQGIGRYSVIRAEIFTPEYAAAQHQQYERVIILQKHLNGKVARRLECKNGRPHGMYEEFNPEGDKILHCEYLDGELIGVAF